MVSDNLQKNKPAEANPEPGGDGHDHAPGPQTEQNHAGDKPAAPAKSTSDSLIGELLADGKEVLNLFRRAFGGGDSKPAEKPPAEKPAPEKPAAEKPATEKAATEKKTDAPAPTFTQLADGTKIGTDGSIEFSASAGEARDAKKDVAHTWNDKQGQHRLEIKDGVVLLDNYRVSEDKIVKRDGQHTTVIDKHTHDIQVDDQGSHFRQNETPEGIQRTLHEQGQGWNFQQNRRQWSITDNQGGTLGVLTPEGVTTGQGDDGQITLLNPGRTVRELKERRLGVHVDEQGNISAELKDGTHVTFLAGQGDDKKGFVLQLKKGDIELQMSLDGKHAKVRRGDGAWEDVPEDAIPKEFKDHVSNGVVQLDGHRRLDIRTRQIYTDDPSQGRHVDWDCARPGTLNVRGGPQVVIKDGHFELVDPKHPDAKPVIWDPEHHRLITSMGVFSDDKVVFNNGDEVYNDGRVRFRNNDGSYDEADRQGNLQTAGGTRIGADMSVRTSDGKSFSARSSGVEGDASVVGSPANAASVADRASAVAASVEGKAMVDFNDVATLASSQGDISMLISTCMGNGDLNSVALLMAAQARVDGALSFALSRAQACAIANQMGVFSPSLIQEMQDNIYGKTPLQAVQSDLDFREITQRPS